MSTDIAIDTTPPLARQAGRAVLTGNELIVKGAIEGGASLITGYPGSPVADVFSICEEHAPRLLELGVEAIMANNEAQSAAMLNGARQVPGARALAVFKSVGAYVALDGLAIANSCVAAADAAAVVVVGDDPAHTSTQVGADTRLTLSSARIPVLEPASFQEIKDYVRVAFELSAGSGLVVGVMVTTSQADGAGLVEVGPDVAPAVGPLRRVSLDTAAVVPSNVVSLPPQSARLEADMLDNRIPTLHRLAAGLGLNHEEPGDIAAVGIVTAGASHVLVADALEELGLRGRVPVLRLGLPTPLDPGPVRAFAAGRAEILVVEERSGHLEDQVRRALVDRGVRVHGKRFGDDPGIPERAGLDQDILRPRLASFVAARPEVFGADAARRAKEVAAAAGNRRRASLSVLARTPTYCAGCPHRGTNSPLLGIRERFRDADYMRRTHGREPVDVIAHGGIGCYSMAFLPPFREMHNLSAMGLGGATGAGAAPHVTNKHYVLVGDGTFFHGEISTMANAIKQRQDILFIVLDNKTTAMTGHQGTPANDTDLLGRPQRALSIRGIVEAMGPDLLVTVNPDDREGYTELLERALLMDGTRVIIADKECAITSGRRVRAERRAVVAERGFLPKETLIDIVEDVCENCRACTTATGCPGLTIVDTPLGEKVAIDRQTCVDDAYCARIKACPSFQEVAIERSAAPRRPEMPTVDHLREPVVADDTSRPYRIVLAGVGGMGIGLVGRILSEAAALAWPALDAYHKKGLAQRGGAVFTHLVLHDGTRPVPGVVGDGAADLIIGLDCLEGARALVHADAARTAAVLETALMPTTTMLEGSERAPEDLVERATAATRPGGLLATGFQAATESALGERIQANVAMVGAAWQRGWLPIPKAAIEGAVRSVAGARSLRAFELGRALAATAEPEAAAPTLDERVAVEAGYIRGVAQRTAFLAAMDRARAAGLDAASLEALVVRLPDILEWGGSSYLDRYLATVERMHAAAPERVASLVHNLHRVMAIKDEVFVSHLLTSPKKYARDAERFGVDPSRGDRIRYVHVNRPAFVIFGRTFERDVRTRDWMLALMRRARFLRRLAPAWHARERAFRDWYEHEVVGAVQSGRLEGAAATEALALPSTVTGYRDIRHPKEDRARARFAELTETGVDLHDRELVAS